VKPQKHTPSSRVNTASSPVGIQIQTSSLRNTAALRLLKNRVSDIGETKMGCQGRKKRVLSKGEERHAGAAIRHGIQKSVARRSNKEI
jgi:hypothetical protein